MGLMENMSTEGVQECLSFRLGDEEYGIDILAVQEIRAFEPPTRIAGAPEHIRGVINLRGVVVPIVDLRMRFGLADAPCNQFTVVIILNVAGRMMGIVVDGVSDVLALREADLRPAPDFATTLIGGACIRGLATLAGRLVILLDIGALVGDAVSAATDA